MAGDVYGWVYYPRDTGEWISPSHYTSNGWTCLSCNTYVPLGQLHNCRVPVTFHGPVFENKMAKAWKAAAKQYFLVDLPMCKEWGLRMEKQRNEALAENERLYNGSRS